MAKPHNTTQANNPKMPVNDQFMSPDFFNASDAAKLCQVDLKTIHNWVEKGEIKHFRTPGRHLRFRRLDIIEFLQKFGYPVPNTLKISKPKILAIENNELIVATLQRVLSRRFDLTVSKDPFDALITIGILEPEAIIIDTNSIITDGIELIHRLRNNPLTTHIKIVVFSETDDLANPSILAGAHDFIPKNEPRQLRQCLEQLTGLEQSPQ